jgi:PAS domain-containing protein
MASDPLRSTAAGIALVGAFGVEIGHIVRANERLADVLAMRLDALVGTRICQHIHPGNHREAHAAFQRVMAHPETLYEGTARLVAANGRIVPVRAVASVITMGPGAAIVVRVLDLSD